MDWTDRKTTAWCLAHASHFVTKAASISRKSHIQALFWQNTWQTKLDENTTWWFCHPFSIDLQLLPFPDTATTVQNTKLLSNGLKDTKKTLLHSNERNADSPSLQGIKEIFSLIHFIQIWKSYLFPINFAVRPGIDIHAIDIHASQSPSRDLLQSFCILELTGRLHSISECQFRQTSEQVLWH